MNDNKIVLTDAETREVWVAWTNTDCTEGRGYQIPLAVCEFESTAIRRGRGGYVQGSNCPVSKATAVKLDGTWLVPGVIEKASESDKQLMVAIEARRQAEAKAKAAGLSDEEIQAIRNTK